MIMFQYLNDNFFLGAYPDEMIDILLEWYNKIKEKFSFINKNSEVYAVDNSLDCEDLMMDSLYKLSDMLEANPLFKEEHYLLLSIINDIEYVVIDNPDLLNENLSFIGNVVINFCNLISDKLDLILSNEIINYEKEFQEFTTFYNNQQEIFYYNGTVKNSTDRICLIAG